MPMETSAGGWPDDEPLPLPKRAVGDDDGDFAPDDDSDLGVDAKTDDVGLDDSEGLDEPVEAELSGKAKAGELERWTEDSDAAGELEGAEDEVAAEQAEYGWTDGNEPAGSDDLDGDDDLGSELRDSAEDSGDEGLGEDDDLGESMELPPLRSGGAGDPDEEGVDGQTLDGDALSDERRVEVLDGVSWTLLPERQVQIDKSEERALAAPQRRVVLGDGSVASISSDGLLQLGTDADPAQRPIPEVGPALCLACDGRRRVAVLAREPAGRARLSLSLDGGLTFERLKLPGTAFPRQLLVLGSTLVVVLPEEGAFAYLGEAFRAVLPGEVQGASLVLEDDEVQLYAHLRTPRGRWLVRTSLGAHSRPPQAITDLGSIAPVELHAVHDAGQTRVELVGEGAAWIVTIHGDERG